MNACDKADMVRKREAGKNRYQTFDQQALLRQRLQDRRVPARKIVRTKTIKANQYDKRFSFRSLLAAFARMLLRPSLHREESGENQPG